MTQTIKVSKQSLLQLTKPTARHQARLPHAKPSTGEGQHAKEDPNQAPFHGSLQKLQRQSITKVIPDSWLIYKSNLIVDYHWESHIKYDYGLVWKLGTPKSYD